MPESGFHFKPVEGVKSYQTQLWHITNWLRRHSTHVTGLELEQPTLRSMEDILDALDAFFEGFIEFLQQVEEEELQEVVKMWYGKSTKSKIITVMDNHLSHHRGQMVVYLRLNGIKPPDYKGW